MPDCGVARTSRLVERLDDTSGGPLVFAGRHADPVVMPRAEVREQAGRAAGGLLAAGIGPGDHVALVGPTEPGIVASIVGCWLAGAAVSVLPTYAHTRSRASIAEQVRSRLAEVKPGVVLMPDALIASGDWPVRAIGFGELRRHGPGDGAGPVDDGTVAVLQFTSGTTSNPRGVIVTHGQLAGHAFAQRAAAGWVDDDVFVSWLPLYHDMGLIGFFGSPLLQDQTCVLIDVGDYARQPRLWPEMIAAHRGTIIGAPDAAYAAAARMPAGGAAPDLSSVRQAFNGGEPIDPRTFDRLAASEVFGSIDRRAHYPTYGLAEATLAVAFPVPGSEPRIIDTPPDLVRHAKAPARLVAVGYAIPGVGLRIADPEAGQLLGEIQVAGEYVTAGYHGRPELTATLFTADGWLHTGDLGLFTDDGQLVVAGRSKDVIILGGRNYLPEEFERVTSSVPGVRPGQAIAFGAPQPSGREGVVIVCEVREVDDAKQVASDVGGAVWDAVGVMTADVVCLEPGGLPKTSSGKRQRARCRAQYLAGELG
ncbi:MAG: putative fatty-acid--CoA ligase [Acidimicrobiales bacterium]|nr:putative fatty-acid--CoA ligase [Acidimicrobiales bacterium]